MTVYIAFDGEYSSRSVMAVFTDRAKAKECSGDVEEHEVDELSAHTMHTVYEVKIRLDDGSLYASSKKIVFESPDYCLSRKEGEWSGGSLFTGYTVYRIAVGISSTSEDHALKMAAEERQSWLRECSLLPKPGIDRLQSALSGTYGK